MLASNMPGMFFRDTVYNEKYLINVQIVTIHRAVDKKSAELCDHICETEYPSCVYFNWNISVNLL